MDDEPFCWNCGKTHEKHGYEGRCLIDLHVSIDAETVKRVTTSGHPKLLRAVLSGKPASNFHVDLSRLTVEGEELPR